ncbi:uncharacterized protein BDW47DRAFT_11863 [Aspergillus candidus]|uniref:Uncharacterized protein n=1 Tax=Aspergillus candidus TaxID=41067 RepID=A0A2I2FGE7_ASPCN|nr:hypothetical protein BDW47DRAFT_11863 [Aspergillus candidus]PLB39707.1 hypothetical protein BDW47DRAFT_11863 [Aspergillus candidus]
MTLLGLLHGLPVWRLLFSTGYCGGLAWLGYYCLWSVSLRHATAAIMEVRRTSRFADGTPLLRRFSPFPTLDAKLVPAVIFYNGLMDGSDPVHRLLLVDIHSTMQATALCILVSSRSSSSSSLFLIVPTIWNIFNQFYGAAFVYPLYLLLESVSRGFDTLRPVDNSRVSAALLVSALLGSLLPFTFLFPAFIPCSVARKQRAIALYRFAPIIFALVQWVGEHLPLEALSVGVHPDSAPYVAAGLAAAVGHFYALGGAVAAARQPRGGTIRWSHIGYVFRRLYLPSATPPPSGIAVLPQAAHTFLQYDVWILLAAFVPYAYLLLAPVVSMSFWIVIPCLLSATVALGPGAMLAFAYALRWHVS